MKRVLTMLIVVLVIVGSFTSCGKIDFIYDYAFDIIEPSDDQAIQENEDNGITDIPNDKGEKNDENDYSNENIRGIVKTEIIDGCLWITYSDDPTKPVNIGSVIAEDSENSVVENEYELDFYPLDGGTYAVMVGKAIYIDKIEIPDTYKGKAVTAILPNAFENCAAKEIIIPNSITTIGDNAFSNCTNLTSIVIPKGVTKIGKGTFYYCTSLSNVTISEGVTEIGSNAFDCCYALKDITIPNSVTKIQGGAFHWCSHLTNVTLENTSGWSMGGNELSSAELADTSVVANYLSNSNYCYKTWERN